MARIEWDKDGERLYETGTDRGVLYVKNGVGGTYSAGVAWNGLTAVTQSPTGAEPNAQYADNIKYLNLISNEEFEATIEAFTYPDEFAECDGSAEVEAGVFLGQQRRSSFGFSYRTLLGNDIDGTDHGYKVHLIYGAMVSPSEKSHNTVNETPEAMTFSWSVTTTPVPIGTVAGKTYRPTAHIAIDSTKVAPEDLTALENLLYGTEGAGDGPSLPTPAEVIALFG